MYFAIKLSVSMDRATEASPKSSSWGLAALAFLLSAAETIEYLLLPLLTLSKA